MEERDGTYSEGDAIHKALEQIETELAELTPRHDALTLRLTRLRRARDTLRTLTGLANERDEREEADRRAVDGNRRAAEAKRMRAYLTAEEAALREYERALQVEARVAEPTSTGRVIELLREAEGERRTRKQIIEEFDRRGWVDPRWREPEAAIRMAIRRAGEDPQVVVNGPDVRWVGEVHRPERTDKGASD